MENEDYSFFNYLYSLKNNYNIHVSIKEFVKFFELDVKAYNIIHPLIFHNNPYCMYVKSKSKLYAKCFLSKKLIGNKLKQFKKGYYGICHAGIKEYIAPVICDNKLIACIDLGLFRAPEDVVNNCIGKICHYSDAIRGVALSHYNHTTQEFDFSQETISKIVENITEYLVNYYLRVKFVELKTSDDNLYSHEDRIISMALNYIKNNFVRSLGEAEIANISGCSVSALSHVFKKRVGMNIKTYINSLRLRQAELYLQNTDANITEIAFAVGFNDSNYFSKLFTQSNKINPKDYRKRCFSSDSSHR